MDKQTVALFGESEKGSFEAAYYCRNLEQLAEYLGHPPPYSHGIFMAVQTILYHRNLIYIRVKEEGYSLQDYYRGLRLLANQDVVRDLAALALPGVGDASLVEASAAICSINDSILITSEYDLYDYLTSRKAA